MTSSSSTARVLIVEDDDEIAGAIAIVLERHGHSSVRCANGKDGLRTFFENPTDLVILDIGLPQMDGWQVLERIRELSEVPVLVLTARGMESDKVRGLASGADDYLTKPFGVRELGARVDALLRRSRIGPPASGDSAEIYQDGSIEIDWSAREVRVSGEIVSLTALEFQLLEVFVQHAGQALSNDQLLRLVWDDPFATAPDRVKFTVLRLRRKLGWTTTEKSRIEAVRGYGYRYRPLR